MPLVESLAKVNDVTKIIKRSFENKYERKDSEGSGNQLQAKDTTIASIQNQNYLDPIKFHIGQAIRSRYNEVEVMDTEKVTHNNRIIFAFLQTKGKIEPVQTHPKNLDEEVEEEAPAQETPEKKEVKGAEMDVDQEEAKEENVEEVVHTQNSFRARIYRNIESPSESASEPNSSLSHNESEEEEADLDGKVGKGVPEAAMARRRKKKQEEMSMFFCLDN